MCPLSFLKLFADTAFGLLCSKRQHRCSPPACSARCTRSKAASHVHSLAATVTIVTTACLWRLPWHASRLRRPLRRLLALRLSHRQCSAKRRTPTRTITYPESGSALLLELSDHAPGSGPQQKARWKGRMALPRKDLANPGQPSLRAAQASVDSSTILARLGLRLCLHTASSAHTRSTCGSRPHVDGHHVS
jgi:hypothetical protein